MKRLIGSLNEGRQRFFGVVFGSANTDGDCHCFSAFRQKWLSLQCRSNSLGNRSGFLAGSFRQYHRKLFTAVPVCGVVGPQAGPNNLAETNQDFIPFKMSEIIIVFLKVIKIQQ